MIVNPLERPGREDQVRTFARMIWLANPRADNRLARERALQLSVLSIHLRRRFATYSASRSVGCSATRLSPMRSRASPAELPEEYVAGQRRVECRICTAPDGSP